MKGRKRKGINGYNLKGRLYSKRIASYEEVYAQKIKLNTKLK